MAQAAAFFCLECVPCFFNMLKFPIEVAINFFNVLWTALSTSGRLRSAATCVWDYTFAPAGRFLVQSVTGVRSFVDWASATVNAIGQGTVLDEKATKTLPLILVVVYEVLYRSFRLVVLLLRCVGRLWYMWFLFSTLLLIWAFVFHPYFMVMEVYPHTSMEVLNMYTKAFADFCNFFLIVWNGIADIMNPFMPFLWTMELAVARLLRLLYVAGKSVVTGQLFEASSSYNTFDRADTVQTARSLEQSFTTANVYGIDKESVGYETYETVIFVIVVVMQLLMDVAFILVEVAIRIALYFVDVLKFFIIIVETVFECLGDNPSAWFCFVWEIFVGMFVALWNLIATLIPLLPAISLEGSVFLCSESMFGDRGISCQCSSTEGGFFKAVGQCETVDVECVTTRRPDGSIWYAATYQGKTINEGANENVVCARQKYDPFVRRSLTRFMDGLGMDPNITRRLEATDKLNCLRTCVPNPSDLKNGWYMRKCPQSNRQYYIGKCDPTTNKRVEADTLTDTVKKHIDEYKKHTYAKEDIVPFFEFYIGPEPVPVFEEGEDEDGSASTEIDFAVFKDIVASVEDTPIDKREGGFGSHFKCEAVTTQLTFQSYLYRSFCFFIRLGSGLRMDTGMGFDPVALVSGMKTKRRLSREQYARENRRYRTRRRNLTYSGVVSLYMRDRDNAGLHTVTRLQNLHRNLIAAHHAHFDAYYPGAPSSIGNGTTFFTDSLSALSNYLQRVNALSAPTSQVVELERQWSSRRSLYAVAPDGTPSADMPINNPALAAGQFTLKCGGRGVCPADGECVPPGGLSKCNWPDKFTWTALVVSVPYYVETGFQKLDFTTFFVDFASCWNEVLDNPGVWPGSPKNLETYIETGRVVGRFCPLMFPRFPNVPYITWSFDVFVRENCGFQITDADTAQRCTCPNYVPGFMFLSDQASWIPGVDIGTYVLLFNGYRASQVIFTQYTPGFVQALWVMVVGLFTSEQASPELWNVFNYQYATAGQTTSQVNVCLLIHAGSIYFTYAFYVFPAIVCVALAGDLFIEIAKLAVEPIALLAVELLAWLTSVAKSVQVRANTQVAVIRFKHTGTAAPAEHIGDTERGAPVQAEEFPSRRQGVPLALKTTEDESVSVPVSSSPLLKLVKYR